MGANQSLAGRCRRNKYNIHHDESDLGAPRHWNTGSAVHLAGFRPTGSLQRASGQEEGASNLVTAASVPSNLNTMHREINEYMNQNEESISTLDHSSHNEHSISTLGHSSHNEHSISTLGHSSHMEENISTLDHPSHIGNNRQILNIETLSGFDNYAAVHTSDPPNSGFETEINDNYATVFKPIDSNCNSIENNRNIKPRTSEIPDKNQDDTYAVVEKCIKSKKCVLLGEDKGDYTVVTMFANTGNKNQKRKKNDKQKTGNQTFTVTDDFKTYSSVKAKDINKTDTKGTISSVDDNYSCVTSGSQSNTEQTIESNGQDSYQMKYATLDLSSTSNNVNEDKYQNSNSKTNLVTECDSIVKPKVFGTKTENLRKDKRKKKKENRCQNENRPIKSDIYEKLPQENNTKSIFLSKLKYRRNNEQPESNKKQAMKAKHLSKRDSALNLILNAAELETDLIEPIHHNQEGVLSGLNLLNPEQNVHSKASDDSPDQCLFSDTGTTRLDKSPDYCTLKVLNTNNESSVIPKSGHSPSSNDAKADGIALKNDVNHLERMSKGTSTSSVVSHSERMSKGTSTSSVVSHSERMSKGTSTSSVVSHSERMSKGMSTSSVVSHSERMSKGMSTSSVVSHSERMSKGTSTSSVVSHSERMSKGTSTSSVVNHSERMSKGSSTSSVANHSERMSKGSSTSSVASQKLECDQQKVETDLKSVSQKSHMQSSDSKTDPDGTCNSERNGSLMDGAFEEDDGFGVQRSKSSQYVNVNDTCDSGVCVFLDEPTGETDCDSLLENEAAISFSDSVFKDIGNKLEAAEELELKTSSSESFERIMTEKSNVNNDRDIVTAIDSPLETPLIKNHDKTKPSTLESKHQEKQLSAVDLGKHVPLIVISEYSTSCPEISKWDESFDSDTSESELSISSQEANFPEIKHLDLSQTCNDEGTLIPFVPRKCSSLPRSIPHAIMESMDISYSDDDDDDVEFSSDNNQFVEVSAYYLEKRLTRKPEHKNQTVFIGQSEGTYSCAIGKPSDISDTNNIRHSRSNSINTGSSPTDDGFNDDMDFKDEDIFGTLTDFVRHPEGVASSNDQMGTNLSDVIKRKLDSSRPGTLENTISDTMIDNSPASVHRRSTSSVVMRQKSHTPVLPPKTRPLTDSHTPALPPKYRPLSDSVCLGNKPKIKRRGQSSIPPLPPRVSAVDETRDTAAGVQPAEVDNALSQVKPLKSRDQARPRPRTFTANMVPISVPPKRSKTFSGDVGAEKIGLLSNPPQDYYIKPRPLPSVPGKLRLSTLNPSRILPKTFKERITRRNVKKDSNRKVQSMILVNSSDTGSEAPPPLPPKRTQTLNRSSVENHLVCLLDIPLRQNGKVIDGEQLLAKHTHDVFTAAAHGRTDYVRTLLNQTNVDVSTADSDGWTLLHHACKSGNPETVKLLVDRGADIKAKTVFGSEPIMIAILEKHKEDTLRRWHKRDVVQIVHELVSAGANINHTDPNGLSTIMIALAMENNYTVDYLLDNDVDVNYPLHLRSILHVVTAQVSRGIVWLELERKMLDRGAHPNVTDCCGRVPASLIFYNTFKEFVDDDVIKGTRDTDYRNNEENVECWDKYVELPKVLRVGKPDPASFGYTVKRLARFLRHLRAGLDLNKMHEDVMTNIDLVLLKENKRSVLRLLHACGHYPNFTKIRTEIQHDLDSLQHMEEELNCPTSLMQLAASAIRTNVYPNAKAKAHKIEVPNILKQYITLDIYPGISFEHISYRKS